MIQKAIKLFLLCCVFGMHYAAAQKTVTGVITDANSGDPLPGASVVVKGISNGVAADFDGKYTITTPNGNSVLIASYIGYKSTEIAVKNRTTINITLSEGTNSLGTVVVTALGITSEKRKLGYALSEIGGDNLSKAREVNVANSLTGRIPGVVIKGTSSGPGGSSKIILRGVSNLSGNSSPLFVIDGVPMDNTQRGSAGVWGGSDSGDGIGNLNSDDIEKMTILKGQAASALYGSRAANGVILVTTKKGDKGGAWGFSYNTNIVIEDAIDYTDFQTQYGQGERGEKPLTAANALKTNRLSWGAKLDGSNVIGFDGNTYNYSKAKNSYIDFYRTGVNLTNSVAVSKGWDAGSFRISVSDLKADAIVPNSNLKRNTVNLNVNQDITDQLNISATINYIDERSKNRPFLSDGPKNPNNFQLLAPNVDHSIFAPGYDLKTGKETVFSDNIFVTNPYFISNQGIEDPSRKRTISVLSAKYNFTDKTYLLGRVGQDISNDKIFSIDPTGLSYSKDTAGALGGRGQSSRSEFNADAILGTAFDLSKTIEIDGLLGVNLRKNEYEAISVGGNPFVVPYLYSPSNVINRTRSYSFNKRESQSAYYSVGASYKEILTLTTTGRYDIYSTLTSPLSNDNDVFSPSISTAFVFNDLMQIDAINFAKFRASYAQTSGEPVNPYSNLLYYGIGNAYNGIAAGSSPLDLPNLSLKPFTTREFEAGLEMKFFDNRLSFDVSYFSKKSKNEIQKANYAISSGYTSGVVATGSIQNKGLEVQVSGVPIVTDNFSWSSSLNFTSIKNEVLKTDLNNNLISLGQNRGTLQNAITAFAVGEAGPQIFAYDYAYDASGNIKLNSQGVPERGEFKSFGSALPKFYGGWNNNFSYKNLNLSFLIDFNFGNKVLSATEYFSIARGLNKRTLVGRDTGKIGDVAIADYYGQLAQNVTSTSVVDGDFIKLRQISLSYKLPQRMMQKVSFLEGIDVSLVARNLAILMRKAKNIDPENNFGSNLTYVGVEGGSLPTTRSLGLSINFKIK